MSHRTAEQAETGPHRALRSLLGLGRKGIEPTALPRRAVAPQGDMSEQEGDMSRMQRELLRQAEYVKGTPEAAFLQLLAAVEERFEGAVQRLPLDMEETGGWQDAYRVILDATNVSGPDSGRLELRGEEQFTLPGSSKKMPWVEIMVGRGDGTCALVYSMPQKSVYEFTKPEKFTVSPRISDTSETEKVLTALEDIQRVFTAASRPHRSLDSEI